MTNLSVEGGRRAKIEARLGRAAPGADALAGGEHTWRVLYDQDIRYLLDTITELTRALDAPVSSVIEAGGKGGGAVSNAQWRSQSPLPPASPTQTPHIIEEHPAASPLKGRDDE